MTLASFDRAARVAMSPRPGARHSLRRLIDLRNGWVIVAAICALYVLSLGALTSFPMQDYANHVARAAILADLFFHHGMHFGRAFAVHLQPVPYVLPDLILASAVAVLGPHLGAGVFTGLVVLSLPGALLLYAHAIELPRRARLFVVLVGLYLSTDMFFFKGFFAFRLAVALVLVSLAVAEMLRKRWSAWLFMTYIAVLVIGYLTHLSALAFTGAAIGVSGLVRLWFRSTTLRRETCLLAPVMVLFACFFGLTGHLRDTVGSWDYRLNPSAARWHELASAKLHRLLDEFSGLGRRAHPSLLVFAACLALPIARELSGSQLRKPAVIEQVALAAAFLGLYLILPLRYIAAGDVDLRAIPLITLLALTACLRIPSRASAEQAFGSVGIVACAALVAVANLAYVMLLLATNNAWLERYRAVVASLPRGSYVLPVHTVSDQTRIHAASHAVLDRGALIPYLFSADRDSPMTYFHYRHQPYAPSAIWYTAQLLGGSDATDTAIDWQRVSCDYDFLLVTAPFDAHLIRIPTVTVAANEAAALLAIRERPRLCRGGSR